MTQTVYVPVSIENKLPEKNGYYSTLCTLPTEIGLIHYHTKAGWQNGFYDDRVTHWLNEVQAILLTPEEAEKIKFVLDFLTQPVFQKDYPEYSKLATESLKIFDK